MKITPRGKAKTIMHSPLKQNHSSKLKQARSIKIDKFGHNNLAIFNSLYMCCKAWITLHTYVKLKSKLCYHKARMKIVLDFQKARLSKSKNVLALWLILSTHCHMTVGQLPTKKWVVISSLEAYKRDFKMKEKSELKKASNTSFTIIFEILWDFQTSFKVQFSIGYKFQSLLSFKIRIHSQTRVKHIQILSYSLNYSSVNSRLLCWNNLRSFCKNPFMCVKGSV